MQKLTLVQFASLGGIARAKKLSKKRRSEIARKAGKSKGKKRLSTPKLASK